MLLYSLDEVVLELHGEPVVVSLVFVVKRCGRVVESDAIRLLLEEE